VVDLARLALLKKSIERGHLTTLGAALYRAGDFQGARQRLVESEKTPRPVGDVWDWLFLAMTDHRRGQREQARRWLDRAAQALDVTTREQLPPGTTTEALLPWEQMLELRLLREEATALLDGPKP
jgi:hypothetical protein